MRFPRPTTIAAFLMITMATCTLPANAQSDRNQGLEGTWRVQVNVISCTTGQLTGPSFSALLSFAEGGTLTGTTSNPAFQPGQRTSDYGVWHQTRGRSYTADSEAFILFSTNNPPFPVSAGKQRITQSITVAGNGFDSVAITRFYDIHNFLLATLCAQATGSRFQ
ncbi:MAG TPA: hypothetical protein VFP40_20045 [Terriglobales bacterium]|nr:hypothetical protein [Terriglobales bacterium]